MIIRLGYKKINCELEIYSNRISCTEDMQWQSNNFVMGGYDADFLIFSSFSI